MIKNKYAIYKRSKHNECVSTQDRVLRLLYGNRAGRMVLGWLIRPEVSKLVGRFMDTGLSRIMINPFIKKNDIDISVCQKNEFDSYNDFFKRKLVPVAPGESSSVLDIKIDSKDTKDSFNVVVVQESTKVLYNEKNEPYADWTQIADTSETAGE